ncbi:MAG: ribosome-associated translation inhibitor RaiA [Pseudomonadales bacterium]|nr:ribosome-associated translation inhibitor RaiA [Pseudomonadales bacterium]
MKFNLTGRHIEVTAAIESAVKKQVNKITRHYPEVETIHVIVSVEKNQQQAELIVHYFSQDLVAKASSNDLYKSLADAKDKMEIMLSKRKGLIKDPSYQKADITEPEGVLTQQEEEEMYAESRA